MKNFRKEYYLQVLTPFAFALSHEFTTTTNIAKRSGLSEELRLVLKKIIKSNALDGDDYAQLKKLFDKIYGTYQALFKGEESKRKYPALYEAFTAFDEQKEKIPCVKFGNTSVYTFEKADLENGELSSEFSGCVLIEKENKEKQDPLFLEQAKSMYEGWLLIERELLKEQKKLIPLINSNILQTTANAISSYLDAKIKLEYEDVKAISDLIKSFYFSLLDSIDDFLDRNSKAPVLENLYDSLNAVMKKSFGKVIGFHESLPMYELHKNFVMHFYPKYQLNSNPQAFFRGSRLLLNKEKELNRKMIQ